jgi:hypothetical protein
VRVRLNRGRNRALVAEQVYWALLSLQQAGAVWREHVADSRKAFWEAAVKITREEVG